VSVGKRQARRPILLITALTLAVLTVVIVTGASSAQTKQRTYDACQPGQDTITASRLPDTVSLQRCPVGERVIRDNGVGTVLPDPGQSVFVDATTTEGFQEFEVTRYRDGTVDLNHVGDESEDAQTSSENVTAASGPGECSDRAFNLRNYKVFVVLRGYFNTNSTPNELSRKAAVRAVRRGTADVYDTRNNCHMGDRVPDRGRHRAGMSYEGSIRARAQVGTGGNCIGQDRKSVVSFGTLRGSALAVTCTERHLIKGKWHTKWSDIMLNKTHFQWTTRPRSRSCNGRKYDVESTVAHERGHTFGLDHVSESTHGNLTMSDRSNGPCQLSERSLGRGDVRGLARTY
jgi:hypothetical protein